MRAFVSALAVASIAGAASAGDPVWINEFLPNPPGSDPADTFIELRGTPNTSFDGFLVNIDTDGGSATGTLNRQDAISGGFDANGLLVVSIADFENPSFTLVLTDTDVSGTGDFDADDDGTIDNLALFGTVFDAINITDSDSDVEYGDDFGGTNFAFIGDEPQLAFRDGITGAWYAVDENGEPNDIFDAAGNLLNAGDFNVDPTVQGFNSFGAQNPFIPAPGALALLGLGGMAAARRRR